jgi:hypothetical protein
VSKWPPRLGGRRTVRSSHNFATDIAFGFHGRDLALLFRKKQNPVSNTPSQWDKDDVPTFIDQSHLRDPEEASLEPDESVATLQPGQDAAASLAAIVASSEDAIIS